MKQTIVIASKNESLKKVVDKIEECNVVDLINKIDDIKLTIEKNHPDILLVMKDLASINELKNKLIDIAKKYKNIKIIYIAGEICEGNIKKQQIVDEMKRAGIEDIITEKKINSKVIGSYMNKKRVKNNKNEKSGISVEIKSFEDVKLTDDYVEEVIEDKVESVNDNNKRFDEVEFNIGEVEECYRAKSNVYTVSSIKPGSGKSMISVCLALGISKFGVLSNKKRKPKVALIEGDLQNLSVGTLLKQKEDSKRNLKAALDKISDLFNDDGRFIGSPSEIDETNKFIRSCFKTYAHDDNLKIMSASSVQAEDLKDIKEEYYVYLIEAIQDEFDFVVVDTNSNIDHVSTQPVLYLAEKCFYVVNLDFNNIRNNTSYLDTIKNIGIMDKVKYVLNEDLEADSVVSGTELEPLEFTKEDLKSVGFNTIADVPLIPKAIMMNRIYRGKPVILDKNEYTKKARYELLKICKEVCEIDGFEELEREVMGGEDMEDIKGRTFFKRGR